MNDRRVVMNDLGVVTTTASHVQPEPVELWRFVFYFLRLGAVAIAMITPGPVVITVAFIGYLIAGPPGMIVAACGVFLPVYLFVIVPAPYFRRHRSQPFVKDFVSGVTAAASGAIAGATYVLGLRAIVDPVTAVLAVGTFVLLWRYRISELWLIASGAALGLAIAAG